MSATNAVRSTIALTIATAAIVSCATTAVTPAGSTASRPCLTERLVTVSNMTDRELDVIYYKPDGSRQLALGVVGPRSTITLSVPDASGGWVYAGSPRRTSNEPEMRDGVSIRLYCSQ